MSYVFGENSEDPKVHFEAGMKDFFRIDIVRFQNIIGSISYGIIYSILFLIFGMFINNIFPKLNKKQSLLTILNWIIFQTVIIIILVFYVRKFIDAIPSIATFFPNYLSKLKEKGFILYGLDEYKGEMTASIILIGTQYNLLEKIIYISKIISNKII